MRKKTTIVPKREQKEQKTIPSKISKTGRFMLTNLGKGKILDMNAVMK